MNPAFRAAAESAQLGWVMGAMTVLFLVLFVGWALWAWHPANRDAMNAAAALPLDEDGGHDA
jgi:cbb3-type cytochrome oxidase subunit 3